jgi:hypothetical protein
MFITVVNVQECHKRVTIRSLIVEGLFQNLFRLHLTVTDANGEVIDGAKIEGKNSLPTKEIEGEAY